MESTGRTEAPAFAARITGMERGARHRSLRFAAACARELEKRMRWRGDPVAYFRERLGVELWGKQVDLVQSVRDHRKTHCRSGHRVGKTLAAAGLALWFLDCWRPSQVITTSASWLDVRMKLWGAIRDLYKHNGSWFGVDVSDTELRISDRHYAVGLSPKEVEPFQGHNEEHVLVLFDEASKHSQEFYDAAEAQATRMVAIGNPLLAQGPFYQYARSGEWNHVHISCLEHPNVVENRVVIPGGPTREWVESRRVHWGERSPLFQTRVLGEFAIESEDTIFPLSVIQASFDAWDSVKSLPPAADCETVLGLDVAHGGDRTVGYRQDRVRLNGDQSTMPRARIVLENRERDHHRLRMRVAEILGSDGYSFCNIDATGEGSGPADEIRAMQFDVRRIQFGAPPRGVKQYFNVRAEMYWELSQALASGMAVEPDEELEEELTVIGSMAGHKEKTVDGVKCLVRFIAPKEQIKEKLGRSPDKADALALANYKGARGGVRVWTI